MASIIVPEHFSAVEDAELLRKACQGWGTNEKGIIEIVAHRDAGQRKQIIQAYEQLYQENLIKRFESELSGDFEKAVYRWMLDPADRNAVLANVAIKKLGRPDYEVIVEIACVSSPEELLEVRRAYKLRYKHSLEEDVAAHTTGDIRKLLVGLVSGYRYEGTEVNARLAKSEAEILQNATVIKDKDNNGSNYEDVIRILSTRSKAQLKAAFNCYRDAHSTSITKNLLAAGREHGKDHPHHLSQLLAIAIKCLDDPHKYFEKVVRNAIRRAGTDEERVTRVIVTRAEKDLEVIKELYYKRNSVTLHQAVTNDTSGHYKAFLLALLGNPTQPNP